MTVKNVNLYLYVGCALSKRIIQPPVNLSVLPKFIYGIGEQLTDFRSVYKELEEWIECRHRELLRNPVCYRKIPRKMKKKKIIRFNEDVIRMSWITYD